MFGGPRIVVIAIVLTVCSGVLVATRFKEKLFFLRSNEKQDGIVKLIVVSWLPSGDHQIGGCESFTDEELIAEVLKSASEPHILNPSEDDTIYLLGNCTEALHRRKRSQANEEYSETDRKVRRLPEHRSFSNDYNGSELEREREQPTTLSSKDLEEQHVNHDAITEGYDGWPVIWPGTKWCGAGDIAKSYDDLGLNMDTDKCCRSHDLCKETLAPGETRNQLTNRSPFTKLSCKCDNDFHDCLDRVDSIISNTIGNLYFNILRRECYEENYPKTKKCKKYRTLLKITCKEYEIDTTATPVYQWVYAKRYNKIPIPGPISITLPF